MVTIEGVGLLGLAILLGVAGLLWIRRIVKDVEDN